MHIFGKHSRLCVGEMHLSASNGGCWVIMRIWDEMKCTSFWGFRGGCVYVGTFLVHPITLHSTQSIIVGVSGWTWYFQPTIWEPKGCPWECSCPWRWRFSPLKGGSSFQGPLILVMPIPVLYIRLRRTQRWSNTLYHAIGNIGVIFLTVGTVAGDQGASDEAMGSSSGGDASMLE